MTRQNLDRRHFERPVLSRELLIENPLLGQAEGRWAAGAAEIGTALSPIGWSLAHPPSPEEEKNTFNRTPGPQKEEEVQKKGHLERETSKVELQEKEETKEARSQEKEVQKGEDVKEQNLEERKLSPPLRFVKLAGGLQQHFELCRQYRGLLDSSTLPARTRFRVAVAGPFDSGKTALIEALTQGGSTKRGWRQRNGGREFTVELLRGCERIKLNLIELPGFEKGDSSWVAQTERMFRETLDFAAEAKAGKIARPGARSDRSASDRCVHLLLYCLPDGLLSPEEAKGLRSLESFVSILPVLTLGAPASEPHVARLKRNFWRSKAARSVSWFEAPDADPNVHPPLPFAVLTGPSQDLETPISLGRKNVQNFNEIIALRDRLLSKEGPAARSLSELRIDKHVQAKCERFGLAKGIFAGLALGVGATLAILGTRGAS